MGDRTLVGFGFGAIQAGLFLYEAFRSGRFSRLVVAEVMPDVVAGVRRQGGRYRLNVATREGIEHHEIHGVEMLNPRVEADACALVEAMAGAAEMATALPSVAFYGTGEPGDVVDLLARGMEMRRAAGRGPAVIYTAENHNHAAEILAEKLRVRGVTPDRVQCLNTVIGKMSGVVTDVAQIMDQGLRTVTDGSPRAFLVEAFNRILISKVAWPSFSRGIEVFEERDNLLPFEEAKLYGHNATHALLGYLLLLRGRSFMADAREEAGLVEWVREAFLEESGGALCRRYGGFDPLFTAEGYRAYVDDLMVRMLNPHLRDSVDRVTRDPQRKLGWDDRLVGTIRLALSQGLRPRRYARGAAAAARALAGPGADIEAVLNGLWRDPAADPAERETVRALILEEEGQL